MDTQTTIYLMRHGEVDNPKGVLYERLPGFHLSELGNQMAQMSADWLVNRNIRIDSIYSSPLERAQESAQPIAETFGLEVEEEERLIEAGSYLRGFPVHARPGSLVSPKMWKYYTNPLRPSWGEPYEDIKARMRVAVSQALAQNQGKTIVMVSHQLPIWTLRRWIEGKPLYHDPRKRECALASFTVLHFCNSKLMGLEYFSPAQELVEQAKDITPGSSKASINRGRETGHSGE